jgi:PAS domain S-box-containing protein
MAREAVLIMDAAGRIVWANRAAHENVGLGPGALLGRNYLEFCPPETHRELLDHHRRKLAGEAVRFRIDLGRPVEVTSGPVKMGRRVYLFAVGRDLVDPSTGDEEALGILAAGELLGSEASRLDLNACVVGALKDEARLLKGRVRLDPGATPAMRGSPWPLRAALRALLRRLSGRISISTGSDARRAWVKLRGESPHAAPKLLLDACRRSVKTQRGVLRADARGVTLSFSRSQGIGR